MSGPDFRIERVPAQPAAWIRTLVPSVEGMVGVMEEFISWTRTRGILFASPIQFIYHEVDWEGGRTDVQIALTVSLADVPATGWTVRLHTPVEVGELPAVPRAAVASLRGPYSAVAGAWNDLITWIYDRGETPAMPIREVYAAGPMDTSDPAAFVTYLQVPLQDQPLRPT